MKGVGEEGSKRGDYFPSTFVIPAEAGIQCAREGALSEGFKSPPGHTLSGPETECNCAAARQGGEQQEVNCRSVG